MYDILVAFMVILSIFSIIVIAIQPKKTQSSSNAFMGGVNYSLKKSRRFQSFLIKSNGCLLDFIFQCRFNIS